MTGKTIATIYFYIISAASLALIVIGIFHGVNFILNSTLYDKYPFRYGPGGDCEGPIIYHMPVKPVSVGEESTPSAKDLDKQRQICLKQQELDRKQHKIEDLKNTLTFGLTGLVLFSIHFPLARKRSNG